jgi:enterochelin esterase-like enzyme
MSNRQASCFGLQRLAVAIALSLLLGLWACAPSNEPLPTLTPLPTSTATLIPPTPTITPLGCLSQPGRLETGTLDIPSAPMAYSVYLPPCYDQFLDKRYPVLYLLHGQTYSMDQWPRLGAVTAADGLILSGESVPFIIVFPDDHYWNLPPGPAFGEQVIENLMPFIDSAYRTLDDREDRAIGGMSRGAGWALQLGLTHPDLFGSLGAHSPVVFLDDAAFLEEWIAAIPPESFPRLFLDIGDRDKEVGYARLLAELLLEYNIPYEWHLYAGDHSEVYWGAHVEEYMRWYAQGFSGE